MKENSISRRNFLRGASAVAMASVLPGSVMAAGKEAAVADTTASTAARKGPKRGVSFYSYSAEFGFEKTLEDCFLVLARRLQGDEGRGAARRGGDWQSASYRT